MAHGKMAYSSFNQFSTLFLLHENFILRNHYWSVVSFVSCLLGISHFILFIY